MNRRNFLTTAISSAVVGSLSTVPKTLRAEISAEPRLRLAPAPGRTAPDIHRHRFGVNYTPSKDWWFCWNDWDINPIQRDLDALAALGADHLRLMLIWPYFQPNPAWVSPKHLERLDQLLSLMAERNLDAVITALTGQLSGFLFLPPFNTPDSAFFTDPAMASAQELYIRELARIAIRHKNTIGFDFGNEINTCWKTDPAIGDLWMARMFKLMASVWPEGIHVNGVDHKPWFEPTTFSQKALASNPLPVIHCYPFWTEALKYGGPMDPPSTKLVAGMANLVRAYAGDAQKPVWAGEFNTCIATMSSKQQAGWLDTAVHTAIDNGVGWFTYWDSHDVDRKFQFHPVEYKLGLLTNDGKVKEEGRVFKQIAEAYRGKPVVIPTATFPPPPTTSTPETTWKWLLEWMQWKPAARA